MPLHPATFGTRRNYKFCCCNGDKMASVCGRHLWLSRHQFARVVSGFTGAGLVFTKWQGSLILSVECGDVIIGNSICVRTILFVYFCEKNAILPEFCLWWVCFDSHWLFSVTWVLRISGLVIWVENGINAHFSHKFGKWRCVEIYCG